MPSTTVIKEQCCEKCDIPRTYEQFIANHTIPLPPSTSGEEDDCIICRLAYGSENLTFHMLDVALRVVDLPGCTHIFGAACIRNLGIPFTTRCCPLCRTKWWNERVTYTDDVDEQTKHKEAETVARGWQTDYNTARYAIYGEPKYADIQPPQGLDQLRLMLRTRDWIKKVVQTDTIQKHIQELQEKHDITLAEVAYDPAKVVEENLMVDPFAFNNYYLHSVAMSFAIFRTLISQRGTRLWLMYHDTICSEQGGEDSSCLDTIEKEWMEMFPEDQVDWV
jgi:hypothetical protein